MREKNWGKVRDLETFEALAPGIQKRNVFGPDTGWNDYVMRHFILPEGIAIPPHCHDWDHLALSLEGHGEVVVEGEHCDLEKGNWVRVPAGKEHSFRNIGDGEFTFLCIVPTHGDPHAKKPAL